MAFSFNDLGSKLTKVTQSAMQKASEATDTAKLNMRTSELNKANQALYAQLGEAYYTAHKDEPEAALSAICAEITKNMGELAQIQQDIQRIRQIKVCPQCGAENPSAAKFCASCSAPLPELAPPKPAGPVCPSCGAAVKEGAAFCTSCGAKLTPPAEDAQP